MITPTQSVIMPYHRNKEMLLYTTSLLDKILPTDVEIIIVGNNANISELDVNMPDRFTYIKYNQSLLYSKTVNMGVDIAHGEIITLCDQDIFGYEDWYTPLLNKLLSSDSIGSVSSKLLSPIDNRIIEFGIEYAKYRIVHPFRGLRCNHPLVSKDRIVTSSTSAILMMRKELYKKVGGMDTDMPYCCSDCDIGIKIGRQGLENWVVSDSVAYHRGSTSSKNGKFSSFSHLQDDSRSMFWAKNYDTITPTINKIIKESCEFFMENNTLDPMYYFINLSTLGEYEWYADCLKESAKIQYCDIYSYPRNATYYLNPIQIYDEIPYTFMNVEIPIIYFVDYFPALQSNKIWARMRNLEKDLVLDCHGNFQFLKDIIEKNC